MDGPKFTRQNEVKAGNPQTMISRKPIRTLIFAAIVALASLCQLQPASAQQRPRDVAEGFPLGIQFTRGLATPTVSTVGEPKTPTGSTRARAIPIWIDPTAPAYSQGVVVASRRVVGFQLAGREAMGEPKASPLLAGLLSAAIPGLGQAYSNDWELSWKSVAFFTVEAGLWVAAISYNSKGDSQTEIFERYADQHWDVTRYAAWIETNIGQLNAGVNTSGMISSTDPLLAPWDRVSWMRINEVEDAIGQRSGTGFTHRLPRRPEQQYYELIGKYAQFGGGWDDAPGFTPNDIVTDNVSPRFLEYSLMRGRANDLYTNASTATYLIVANHVVSALEAAWSTSRANKRIDARAELRRIDRGGWSERVPHVSIAMKL